MDILRVTANSFTYKKSLNMSAHFRRWDKQNQICFAEKLGRKDWIFPGISYWSEQLFLALVSTDNLSKTVTSGACHSMPTSRWRMILSNLIAAGVWRLLFGKVSVTGLKSLLLSSMLLVVELMVLLAPRLPVLATVSHLGSHILPL